MTALLEIEINDDHNRDFFFPPIGRKVRGRVEVARAVQFDKDATELLTRWPHPIPGQRLGIDADTGEGYLAEPLHDDEFSVTRELIKSRRYGLEPAIKRYPVDKPTWMFWLKSAVDSGHARVTVGKLPETIEGEPKTSFFVTHQKSATVQLAEAIKENTAVMAKLLTEVLGKKR